jgi:hypothetical protein
MTKDENKRPLSKNFNFEDELLDKKQNTNLKIVIDIKKRELKIVA